MRKSNRYPSSVPYIIANEGAERFSFYGMKSILATFLVAQFFNPSLNPALQTVAEAKANEATHFFVSLAYALPFIGGLVADWFTALVNRSISSNTSFFGQLSGAKYYWF